VRIEKLSPEKHTRRARIQDLPEPYRTRAIGKRHELLTKWQEERRQITTNAKACYGLASAIAVELVIHPRGSEWGNSMFHKRGGLARMRKISPQDLKIFTREGGLCSRTTRRTIKARQKQYLEAEGERKLGVGPDGVIPTAWYKH